MASEIGGREAICLPTCDCMECIFYVKCSNSVVQLHWHMHNLQFISQLDDTVYAYVGPDSVHIMDNYTAMEWY